MKKFTRFILLILLVLGCNKEETPTPDEEPPPIDNSADPDPVDEDFFKALTMADPLWEVLHDSIHNLLYVVDREVGQIVCYDYINRDAIATTTKDFFVSNYQLTLYPKQDQTELYIGSNQSIYIYDGLTLAFKDSIRVFEDDDARIVSSLEAPTEDLLLVGGLQFIIWCRQKRHHCLK